MREIKKVAVIGAGSMGRQIAMNTVLNGREYGYEVSLCDSSEAALEKAAAWADSYLKERVLKGRITREEADEASGRLFMEYDRKAACAGADLIIEAVIEDLQVKRELFAEISRYCHGDTILATNSSNIVSSRLSDVTERPERLLNVHYFNPALVMELVELVKGPHTSNETIERMREFAVHTKKAPIVLQKEIAGFVANRINAAVSREALMLLEKGIASVEDIDAACEKGLGYPMGPFRLMDLTGIDVNYYVRRDRYAESMDENDRPSPLVVEKYKRGEYGRKAGKGWYNYG